MCGQKGSMAHLQINNNIGCDIFVPGQLFTFNNIILHANSTGRVDHVESFVSNQVINFGSLEYTADSHGDLALSDWMPDRLENSSDTVALTPEPSPDPGFGSDLASEPTSSMDLIIVASDPNPSMGRTTVLSDLDLESSPSSESALSLVPIS